MLSISLVEKLLFCLDLCGVIEVSKAAAGQSIQYCRLDQDQQHDYRVPAVAMAHYAQVAEADLQEAAKLTLLNDAEKTVQKSVLTIAEQSRTASHEGNPASVVSPCYCESNLHKTKACESMRNAGKWAELDSNQRKLTLTGLQPVPFSHSGIDPIYSK